MFSHSGFLQHLVSWFLAACCFFVTCSLQENKGFIIIMCLERKFQSLRSGWPDTHAAADMANW